MLFTRNTSNISIILNLLVHLSECIGSVRLKAVTLAPAKVCPCSSSILQTLPHSHDQLAEWDGFVNSVDRNLIQRMVHVSGSRANAAFT